MCAELFPPSVAASTWIDGPELAAGGGTKGENWCDLPASWCCFASTADEIWTILSELDRYHFGYQRVQLYIRSPFVVGVAIFPE